MLQRTKNLASMACMVMGTWEVKTSKMTQKGMKFMWGRLEVMTALSETLSMRRSALRAGNTENETMGAEELEPRGTEGFVGDPVASAGENLTMVGKGKQATRGVKVGTGFCATGA